MALTLSPNFPPQLEVRAIKRCDKREVRNLWERRTGLSIDNTLDLLFEEDSGVIGFVVTEIERVVGFCVLMGVYPDEVDDQFPVAGDQLTIGELNAIMCSSAVTEAWEHRGIGSELMRLRLEYLKQIEGMEMVFGKAWCRADHKDSSVLFEKFGFEAVQTVENAYQGSSKYQNCPDCLPEQCTCSATVYQLRLPTNSQSVR